MTRTPVGDRMYVNTGGRRNEKTLTPEQRRECVEFAVKIGMPKDRILFSEHTETSYTGILFDTLIIGTDVYPSADGQTANSQLSYRATLSHEIIGHRITCLRGTQNTGVLDEIQASLRAAKFCTELTDEDRDCLIRDAKERALNHGINFDEILKDLDIWRE